MKERGLVFGALLVFVLLSVGVLGQGDPQLGPVEPTITITNEPPQIVYVSNPGTINPLAGGIVAVGVSFIAQDPNGAGDLDETTAVIEFDGPQPNFYNRVGSCVQAPTCQGCSSDQKNLSCSVDMNYYDDPTVTVPDDLWNIVVNISDKDTPPNSVGDNSQSFTYNELTAVNHEGAITWTGIGLGVGDLNQVADGSPPMTLVNQGNVDLSVNIEAHDLLGQTLPSQVIPSESFTTGPNTGGIPPAECNDAGTATRLPADGLPDVPIAGLIVNYGPSGNTDPLYFCIPESLNGLGLSDPVGYTATGANQWVIIV